ncbi:MAG: dephospho-CoA kinase [bacterium]
MSDVLVVGLTGGLATGKTTIAEIFNTLGAIIIDADKVAREIVKPNSSTWQELTEYFGTKILNDDLTINRKLLSDLVFSNETYRIKLNEITHPTIIQRIKEEIEKLRSSGKAKIVIIDAPLLIEAKMASMVDRLIVVTASEITQIKRVMKRDNLSPDAAKNKINSQMPLSEKVKLADFVIDTDCQKTELKEKVIKIWDKLTLVTGNW